MIDDAPRPHTPQQPIDSARGEVRFVTGSDRIPTYVMNREEADRLREATDLVGLTFDHATAPDQLRIARLMATHLRLAAPLLCAAIEATLDSAIRRITGIPVGGPGDQVRATALSVLRGEIFQYVEQLDGRLTAPIEPKPDGAPNSNASPEPFGWHCDDSVMPARFRVEEIALLSTHNPAGTLTGFAILKEIL